MNNTPPRPRQDSSFGPLAVLPSNHLASSSKVRQPQTRNLLQPYKFASPITSPFLDHLKGSPWTTSETSSSALTGRKTGTCRPPPPSSSSSSSSSTTTTTATTTTTGRIPSREVRPDVVNTARKSENAEIMPHMAAMGLNSLIPNPVLPGLPFGSVSSPFALKLGALSSPHNPTMPGLAGRPGVSSFPPGSLPSRSNNLPPPALPPNMALFPSPLDPPPSLLPMSPLLQYPAVLATSLGPEEQQYLRMAQLQADSSSSSSSSKGLPGAFKTPYTSRNYLELAMLVCNTFRGKLFPCPHCRYVTDRRNNLKRHVATMHQACDKQLECCGVTFATKASLREHIAIFHHNGYSCAFCGRRFCRKALLKRHLSVHNGQKDYTCPHCDYATSHKSNLERHKRIHARINVVGGSSTFPDDREDVDHEGRRFLDEHESRFVGQSDRFSDRKNNNICFQDGPLSSFEMAKSMNESEKLNSVMNRCLERRSSFPCSESGLSRLGLRAADVDLTRDDKKESVFGTTEEEDELDSGSDIDIDGMEDSDFHDSDDEGKVSRSSNSVIAMACDHDEMHPLNLVKIKVSAD